VGFGTFAPATTDKVYLPEKEDGLILFATRHREAAVSLAGGDVVELQEMNRQEALAFLENSLTRKDVLYDKLYFRTSSVLARISNDVLSWNFSVITEINLEVMKRFAACLARCHPRASERHCEYKAPYHHYKPKHINGHSKRRLQ
jgi:hypothetical protein